MGQFKPMVKMETTEPSVELKLKNGGHVAMKRGGSTTEAKKMAFGGLPSSMPASMPPAVDKDTLVASSPKKPSMASRRKAMMGAKAPVTPVMKKGGEAHDDAAQDRAMIKKALAGKKYATGGVVMGQGGYKDGGNVKSVKDSEKGAKEYVNTKMDMTKKGTKTGATGQVKKGNGGGYAKGGGVEGNVSGTPAGVTNTKTGDVRLGNAGGYRKGGGAKKFADGGGVQNDGRPVKMPQGSKRPPSPVSINQLSGTYRNGGRTKKMAEGGDAQVERNERAYKQYEADEEKFNKGLRSDLESAVTYPFRKIKQMFADKPSGSVTKTKESVTVAKKSGGKC